MNQPVFIITFLNICMLFALAYIITRSRTFRRILYPAGRDIFPVSSNAQLQWLNSSPYVRSIALGIIMGVFCMLSNQVGFMVEGSIPNSRVIGAMAAGMLGGPISGMTAASIGALHRYLGEPTRISTPGCVIATLLQGVIGSALWYFNRQKPNYSRKVLYLSCLLAEAMHMWLIYVTVPDKSAAIPILNIIAFPMMLINPVGMVMFFAIIGDVLQRDDQEAAIMVARSLQTSEKCVPFLRTNITPEEERRDIAEILKIIMEEDLYVGAAVLRDTTFLGRTAAFDILPEKLDSLPEILDAARQEGCAIHRDQPGPVGEAPFAPLYRRHQIIAAPVDVRSNETDYLVVLIRKDAYLAQLSTSYVDALAHFFSTQFQLNQMEEQKILLQRAELATLQSQVNPHFLFNSLNTISFFCREQPEKARELIIALSKYFRQTLRQESTMVSLADEMSHVRSYLLLEQARFEERLKITIEEDPEVMHVQVPNLILQPLVENGVKYGAKKAMAAHRLPGEVRIRIRRVGDQVETAVLDNGPGIPDTVMKCLQTGETVTSESPDGNGVGMQNVHRRLVTLWGEGAGLQYHREDGWSCMFFRIPADREE